MRRARPTSAAKAGPYRVLARKYRPATFDDLIGQDAMVRTLANAFATDRIAQAYMLTGVRGVGKTTTARILARASITNAADGDRRARPSTCRSSACIARRSWKAAMSTCIEMDAASNTGIDNMREIIESVRYEPVIGALQGLHHRRSAHAVEGGLQRAPEDAGGAAART